jgi:hypothetical protein
MPMIFHIPVVLIRKFVVNSISNDPPRLHLHVHGESIPFVLPTKTFTKGRAKFLIPIFSKSLSFRAELLLDQYRKKSQLYRSNILFIQLGDDFRYQTIGETKNQFANYDRLLTYINQRTDWHVQVRFHLYRLYLIKNIRFNMVH